MSDFIDDEETVVDLSELISKVIAAQGSRPPSGNRPIPEAQIMMLQEIFRDYRTPDRFQPGDIVTVKSGCAATTIGMPHIVLETNKHAEPDWHFNEPPVSQIYGRRHDVRVAVLRNGSYCCFWVESWELEPYVESKGPQKIDITQGTA